MSKSGQNQRRSGSSPARRAAFEILLRVETQASYAADLLNSRLTANLTERDAALCTELVLGTLRRQLTLDFTAQRFTQPKWTSLDPEVRVALRMGFYQLRYLSRVPVSAAVNETVELVKIGGKRSASGLVNAVLRKAEASGIRSCELASLRPSTMPDSEWLAIEYSHPAWLLQRWTERFGLVQAQALADANNELPTTFLRLNPELENPSGLKEQLRAQLSAEEIELRPGNILNDSLAVARGNITRTQAYKRREITLQDEAAQAVAYLLDVQAGDRVLDLCAAPGNKTAQLAELAGGPGNVVACDLYVHRLARMTAGSRLSNIARVALDGTQPLPFGIEFDRILVDAPCSGTGTLRKNPEIKWRLKPSDILELAQQQQQLLNSAAAVLRAGGRIVYSTCSLEREENQAVIESFLISHPQFRLFPLREDAARIRPAFQRTAWPLLDGKFLETTPAEHGTDGFFAAILVKRWPDAEASEEDVSSGEKAATLHPHAVIK